MITQKFYLFNKAQNNINFNDTQSVSLFMDKGLGSYRNYLVHYSDRDLIYFFYNIQLGNKDDVLQLEEDELQSLPLMTLMPAYALSEIQSAFKIAFYL